jgi:hypothetical protein
MTNETAAVLAAGPAIEAALAEARDVFSALNGELPGAVAGFERLSAAALLLENDARTRGILDGAVGQRARAASVAVERARAEAAALVAALSSLAGDVARLEEEPAE